MANALIDVIDAAGDGESVEKLNRILTDVLPQLEPADEQAAQKLQLLHAVLPHVVAMLPTDADTLDGHLAGAAELMLALRSDDADPAADVLERETQRIGVELAL